MKKTELLIINILEILLTLEAQSLGKGFALTNNNNLMKNLF